MLNWADIPAVWMAAFEEAWKAYCAGAIPIGAVIVNGADEVVVSGRNTVRGSPPNNGSYGNKLCHAEVNALFQLSERSHPDYQEYVLFTTMEPCPLCFGAFVMSKLRHCRFAARDAIAGSAKLARASDYLVQRNLEFIGPVVGLEEIQLALLSEYMLRYRPTEADSLLSRWARSCGAGVNWGRRLFESAELHDARLRLAPIDEVACTIFNAG